MYTSFLNREDVARGLSNNNPGNLIYTGIEWEGKIPYSQNQDKDGNTVVKKFEQFKELRYGLRAMMHDVFNGYKAGENTIAKLITSYAPPTENKTANYINYMVGKLGFAASYVIPEMTQPMLVLIVKAIILFENGAETANLISDKDYKDALAILGVDVPKGSNVKKNAFLLLLLAGLLTLLILKINKDHGNRK